MEYATFNRFAKTKKVRGSTTFEEIERLMEGGIAKKSELFWDYMSKRALRKLAQGVSLNEVEIIAAKEHGVKKIHRDVHPVGVVSFG